MIDWNKELIKGIAALPLTEATYSVENDRGTCVLFRLNQDIEHINY